MNQSRRPPLKAMVRTEPNPDDIRLRQKRALWVLLIAALAMLLAAQSRAEDDKASKEYAERLNRNRQAAGLRDAADSAKTDDQKRAARKAMQDAQARDLTKRNMAEYKQKTFENLGSIKELFAKAEDCWKNKKIGEAGHLYNSVAMATVPGSEQMVETSRGRLVEMEDMAKNHLKNADDSDLKREYVKEVEELALINREFALTTSREVALRRLVSLKSRPEISGYVELAQAEVLETDGKLMESIAAYNSIATNPRYENSVAALKAKRKLDELHTNEITRAKIKLEADAKADREAPILLASAKNFISNNLPKQAIEKLNQVIEKFPNSKYAEDAKKQIAELK